MKGHTEEVFGHYELEKGTMVKRKSPFTKEKGTLKREGKQFDKICIYSA